MRTSAGRLMGGGILLGLTLLGIGMLLALNERLTWPASQELIDQLVTTNPRTTGDWLEKLPATWSDAEDARVHRVIERLEADPRRHMDALIANVDRAEFSATMSTSVPFKPLSVGMICSQVIEDHFYHYCSSDAREDPSLPAKGWQPEYFGVMTRVRMTAWWAENHGKSDREIGRMIATWHRAERVARHQRK